MCFALPSSRASAFVRPISADLLVAYSVPPGPGTRCVMQVPIVTIRPPSGRRPAAACEARKAARTFTARTRSTSARVSDSSGPRTPAPTLFTRTSSRPRASAAHSTAPAASPASAASARRGNALRPAASIRPATSLAAASSRT